MTNRNKIKQWFLTYPQWKHEDKNTIRDKLIANFNIDYYKVCKETHEDGNPHYHAVIRLRKPMSKAQLLKKFKDMYALNNKRIDVKPVRSIKHSIQYLSKEDTAPLESAGGFISKRNPRTSILTTFVRSLGYNSLADFNIQYPVEELQYRRLESDMLKCNKEFESLLKNQELTWSQICMIPEVNKFYEIRRKISNILIRISKDDMTFFIKFYKIKVEPLLTQGGSNGHYRSPPGRLQDDISML